MRKQAWIHLHGLMSEIANYYEERTGENIDLGDYEELGVRPTSIHKTKADHKTAVFSLAHSITDTMDKPEDYEALFDSRMEQGEDSSLQR
ncbi:MAG: UPF0058 family protein [Candidatus Aenigmatarchaeota archaeon]